MGARGVLMRRELRSIVSEKTILVAIVIQIVIAGFSSFLVVGLASLVDPSSLPPGEEATLAYVGPPDVLRHLEAEGLRVQHWRSEEMARDVFAQGNADAVLIVDPPGADADDAVHVRLTLPESNLRATLTLVQVRTALERYEQTLREERSHRLTHEPVYVHAPQGSSYGFVYTLLVPLLVLLPVVLAGALTADGLTEEVQRGTFALLLTTPARVHEIVDGKLLANVLLAPLLSAAWLLLLAANGLRMPLEGAVAILVLATAAALLFGVLACGVAFLTKDRNRAHLVYAVLLFVVLALAVLLPASPMNAIARFAAASPSGEEYAAVAATVIASLGLYAALQAWLRVRKGDALLGSR